MCSDVRRIARDRVVVHVWLLLTVFCSQPCCSLPLSDFYPFNSTFGDSQTPKLDDGTILAAHLDSDGGFPLFNKTCRKIFMTNNGIISFDKSDDNYKPQNFPRKQDLQPIIAPFWADIDVMEVGGTVWYRNDSTANLLNRSSQEIRRFFPRHRDFNASWIFIATWDNVGFYGANKEGKTRHLDCDGFDCDNAHLIKRNTFQAVLVTDWKQSYAIFNYNKIQWTTGLNSLGNISTGLGGEEAQAGFDAGNGKNFLVIDGAQKPSILNITLTSNVGIQGKWIFRIDLADIQKEGCIDDDLLVMPKSGIMLGGQRLTISGPCFLKVQKFSAVFKEIDVTFPCDVMDELTAYCVTPSLLKTGEFTLSFDLIPNEKQYEETFSVVNLADFPPQVVREKPTQWFLGSKVVISWKQNVIPSNKAFVNILGLEMAGSSLKWHDVQTINPNSIDGSHNFILKDGLSKFTLAIIRVSEQNSSFSLPVTLWSDVFPVRSKNRSLHTYKCEKWLKEPKAISLEADTCPCKFRQAKADTSRYARDPFCNKDSVDNPLNCIYQGTAASHCVQLNLQSESTEGQSCCFGEDGTLLNALDGTGGGTVFRYHYRAQGPNIIPYLSHFEADISPYLQCCEFSGDSGLCRKFLKFNKPSTCGSYVPPSPAQAAGDPHLVTLDGKSFTFNGVGDYVLLQDKNNTAVIQVRAEQARDIEGQVQNATIFTSIAMQIKNISDRVEVKMDKDDLYSLLVNGKTVELISTLELKGVSIRQGNITNTFKEVVVVFDSMALSVSIEASADLLNILIIMGSRRLRGNLEGLLGNYNGNADDDFVSRNGTVLSSDADMKELHYFFGETWSVDKMENLFSKAVEPKNPDLTYQPVFLDKLDKGSLRNQTLSICGSKAVQCIFDFQVTGKKSIALSTKKFVSRFEALRKDMKKVMPCPYIDNVPHAEKNVSGYLEGAIATFACAPGYELIGASVLNCTENGTWVPGIPNCPEYQEEEENNFKQILMIAGVTSGLVFVLIIIFGCIIKKSKCQKREDDTSHPTILLPSILPPSTTPQPVFENPLFLQSLQKLYDGGAFKIPRPTYIDPKIYEEYF